MFRFAPSRFLTPARLALVPTVAVLTAAALTACHSPKGGIMPFTGGSHVYRSTEDKPTSVKLVDTRTGEELFNMDIPVGKELTIDFDEEGGDDRVKRPCVMKWQVNDLKTKIGSLRNQQSVPNSYSRRLDIYFRPAPEFAQPPQEESVQVQQPGQKPSWWTAQGGPLPKNNGATMYDN